MIFLLVITVSQFKYQVDVGYQVVFFELKSLTLG